MISVGCRKRCRLNKSTLLTMPNLFFSPRYFLLSSTRGEHHTVFLFLGSLSILRAAAFCVSVYVLRTCAYMCCSSSAATENITQCQRVSILDVESLSAEYFKSHYLIIII